MVLVLGGLLLGGRLVSQADHTVGVWRLVHDVPAGAGVSRDDLAAARVHFDDSGTLGRYVSVGEQLPAGARAGHDLDTGDLLAWSAVSTGGATAGLQLPLAVPASGLPLGLQAGDRVDVWAVPERDSAAASAGARRALAAATVASVEPAARGFGGVAGERSVLIRVSRQADLSQVLSMLAGHSIVLVRLER
ncbi:MAG TPA: hypothetical protein VFI30_00690 [Nocardioidaceae bacterium]|nr:hypothetical protein [Nocardioidaceae bacterium]